MDIAIVGRGAEAAAFADAAIAAGFAAASFVSPSEAPDMPGGLAFCAGEDAAGGAEALGAKGYDVAVPGRVLADMDTALRLDALYRERGRKAVAVFFERYAPHGANVKRLLAEGAIGRAGMLDMLKSWPVDGHSALQPLCEGLDLAVSWFGFPAHAKGFRASRGGLDCAALTAQFADGMLLNLRSYCGGGGEALLEYELSGAQGNLAYDAARARSVRMQPALAPGFPFLPEFMGTAMCPIAAALRDLPARLRAQGHGMAEEGMRMADILRRAFSEARGYRA